MLCRSEISRNDDHLNELKTYRQFLSELAPQVLTVMIIILSTVLVHYRNGMKLGSEDWNKTKGRVMPQTMKNLKKK